MRPLYFGWNASTSIAGPVVLVNAAPTPCTNRKIISHVPEPDSPQSKDDRVKIITPILNSLRMPVRSPQRPTGNRNMAVASRNDVTTQLRVMAFRLNDFSIDGKAIFTDDMRNVPINEVIATIASIDTCLRVHCIFYYL